MIEMDVAWDALEEHLLAGAARIWGLMLEGIPEERMAEFMARLDAGEMAIGGEWTRVLDEQGDVASFNITQEELALPSFAFGVEEPGGAVAVFLVMHPIPGESEDAHSYVGIGWIEDAWVPSKPALRVIDGGKDEPDTRHEADDY